MLVISHESMTTPKGKAFMMMMMMINKGELKVKHPPGAQTPTSCLPDVKIHDCHIDAGCQGRIVRRLPGRIVRLLPGNKSA